MVKQAWRILQYPDCLFSRVMVGRYCESVGFLLAGLGKRPSYVWKSILHGRDLLQKGLKKLVGNGRSSRVWIDPLIFDK